LITKLKYPQHITILIYFINELLKLLKLLKYDTTLIYFII